MVAAVGIAMPGVSLILIMVVVGYVALVALVCVAIWVFVTNQKPK